MTYDIHLQFIKDQLGRFKRRPNKPQPKPISNYYQDIEFDNYWQFIEWSSIHTGIHIKPKGGERT